MNFDLCSDLHVDADRLLAPPTRLARAGDRFRGRSEVLIMAGDVSDSVQLTLDTVEEAGYHYERVLFVDGNHEHYSGDQPVTENRRRLTRLADEWEFATYLPAVPYVRIDDTAFCGINGWYSLDAPGQSPEDQRLAWRNWAMDASTVRFRSDSGYRDPDDPIRAARRDAEQLAAGLRSARSDPEVRAVVAVTHVLPVREALVPVDHPLARSNGWFFSSELEALLGDPETRPDVWVFGHTHFRKSFELQGVRFLAHPYGYPDQRTGGRRPLKVQVSGLPR